MVDLSLSNDLENFISNECLEEMVMKLPTSIDELRSNYIN
jgi:hypothetical protein